MKKDYGIVVIKSCVSGRVLDHHRGKSVATCTGDNGHPTLQWYRVPRDAEYIALQNVDTGKVLDHYYGRRIEAYDDDVLNWHHQWKEIDVGDGCIALMNRASGALLRFESDKRVSTAHEGTSDNCNQWTYEWIQEAEPLISIKSVSSGAYLEDRGRDDRDMPLSSAVSNRRTDEHLQWTINDLGNGLVSIKNFGSGEYLDGCEIKTRESSTSCATLDPSTEQDLQWKIAHADDGTVSIQSTSSGRYLDGSSTAKSSKLVLAAESRRPSTDKQLQWTIDFLFDEPAEHPAKPTQVATFTTCACASCVGVDRVDPVVIGDSPIRSYPNEPPHFPSSLKLLNLYLCDAFLSTVMGGLNAKSSLPRETVDQICDRLRLEAMKNHEQLSIGYQDEFRMFAHAQLEEAINKLGRFAVAWNESKRIEFTTEEIPGMARVIAVDTTSLNAYVSSTLAQQRSSFAGSDCIFMDWLKAADKESIRSLFQLESLSLDTLRQRRVDKLHGACSGLCDFQISHLVTVKESSSNLSKAYVVRSPVTDISYQSEHITAASVHEAIGWDCGGVKTYQPSTSQNQTLQQTRTVIFSTQGYRCEVDVVVSNKTHAYLWVHAVSAIFSFGIMAAANHSVDFLTELPLRLVLDVPLEYIIAAWVRNPVGDLLNQLMGDPFVSILCAGRGLHALAPQNEDNVVLTDQRPTQSSVHDVGLFGAAFIIHENPGNGRFYLSVATKKVFSDPERTPFEAVGDALHALETREEPSKTSKLSTKVWVNVDSYGRVVLAETPEVFKLHRCSSRYKHWVLHAQSRNAFVERRVDGYFYATATKPAGGSELTFSRVYNPPK